MALPSGTNYPTSIDGVSNGYGAVSSGQVITSAYGNDLASAILALETTVGANPLSGSSYSTVGAALAGKADISSLQKDAYTYAADTGSANAYAIALSPTPPTYTAGQMVVFKALHANTGASTLAVNGQAAKALVKDGGTALSGGEIAAGQVMAAVYDGTQFQLIGPVGGGLQAVPLLGGQTNGSASSAPIGTPVYQTSTSGEFNLAEANAFGTSRVVALVYDTSIASSATGNVQTGGVFTFASTAEVDAVCGTSGGFGTPGEVFFLSDATAGTLTSTAPSTAGHFLVPVLQAITSTTAYMLLPAQIVGL